MSAGTMYRVGEGNRPEMFVGDSGRSYMIPGERGKVIGNGDLGGATKAPTIIIQNMGTPQQVQSQSYDPSTNTAKLVMADLINQVDGNSGPFYNALTRSTNVRGRL